MPKNTREARRRRISWEKPNRRSTPDTLKGSGFEIEDCGIDVSPEKFVEKVRSSGANILAMSSLITTSMQAMGNTIEALKSSGLRDSVKVMIGGAPITEGFARQAVSS